MNTTTIPPTPREIRDNLRRLASLSVHSPHTGHDWRYIVFHRVEGKNDAYGCYEKTGGCDDIFGSEDYYFARSLAVEPRTGEIYVLIPGEPPMWERTLEPAA
ncbi:MAG: hypothetical protein LBK99_05195 [Opitutaceae bacterium]|jgi:hypothetical protein|nr:hypothetical protein [Opitutaceae bacterium]